MGSNHSKPCCGVFERESRRAYQESVQQLFRLQQTLALLSDVPEEETHVYGSEDEEDQGLEEINTDPTVIQVKVGNIPEMKDSFLDDSEKLGAPEISATVLAEPGVDVTETLVPVGDVIVRSEPEGAIMLGTGALPPELDGTLESMCQQVLHTLYVQKFSRHPSEKTKWHTAVEDRSPSSLEPQPSVLSLGTQTRSPSFGDEMESSRDVHRPREDVFWENAQKAPCRTVLELATGDLLGTGKECTSGPVKLEYPSSEETLVDTDETLSESGTTEPADNVKMDPGTKEVAGILRSLDSDLIRPASGPLPILSEREGKVSEDYYDGGNLDAQLPKRARWGMSTTVDSEDETEWPVSAQIVRTRLSHWTSLPMLCEKTDVLVASHAEDLHSLPKDEAISVSKGNQRQESVVNSVETQLSTCIAEMTGAVSSPKALLETSEIEQGGSSSPSKEPTAQVNGNAQLSPKSTKISHLATEDGALIKDAKSLAPKRCSNGQDQKGLPDSFAWF